VGLFDAFHTSNVLLRIESVSDCQLRSLSPVCIIARWEAVNVRVRIDERAGSSRSECSPSLSLRGALLH